MKKDKLSGYSFIILCTENKDSKLIQLCQNNLHNITLSLAESYKNDNIYINTVNRDFYKSYNKHIPVPEMVINNTTRILEPIFTKLTTIFDDEQDKYNYGKYIENYVRQ